jgi:hypothetical protein
MMKNRIAALIAAPAIAGAILGGAALGFAGTASAQNSYSYDDQGTNSGNFYSPTTYADPATTYVPWGAWINGSY